MEADGTMPSSTTICEPLLPKHYGVPCQQQRCCENKFIFLAFFMCVRVTHHYQGQGPSQE